MLSVLFLSLLLVSFSACVKGPSSPDPIGMLIGQEHLEHVHTSRLSDKESPCTLSLYIFTSPVSYYKEDDTLELIDKALVSVRDLERKKQGYSLEIKSCNIKSYFPKDFAKHRFSFSPVPELVSQKIKRSSYMDVLGREHSSAVYQKDGKVRAEYIPTTAGIMTNIVIEEKADVEFLEFYIEKQKDLSCSIVDNQYALFRSGEENTNKAVIYTSFLQDANGNAGFGNRIQITEEKDKWKYMIVLDQDFLEDPETQYPVSIAPTFELCRSKMPDSSMYEKRPSVNVFLANYFVSGDKETFGDAQHYLRFRINYIFKSYPQNVKSASYVTTVLAGSETVRSIEMKRLKEMWSSTGAAWNSNYQMYETESITELGKPGRYKFDIYEFVKDCIRDDEWNTEGYGLAMTSEKDGENMKIIATSDNTFYQPYVRIDFYDLPWTFEKAYAINPDQGI